ncbi:hypothetical protein [Deinococcus sp.]|uniref:hypothetical protein n=1 Tax=Deinococcus sp. TaxID=47478 RepID=UPI0025FE72B5|nr:hypothetical protein [Deinococcus sp.]
MDLFKYVLPRLLELMTERELLTDSEIVLSKLTYGDRRTWLEAEQQAIEEFLMAWWVQTLARLSEYSDTRADEALSSIAQAEDNLAPYLDRWFKDESAAAITHLILFIDFGWREEGLKYEAGAFWESRPQQTQQLMAWLYSVPVGQKIEAGLAVASTFGLNPEVEDVCERVRTIIHHYYPQYL